MSEKNTSVSLVPADAFVIMEHGVEQIKNVIEANLRGQVDEFLLERVRIPAGGGLAWVCLDDFGEEIVTKELQGVIVGWATPRVYWQDLFGQGTAEDRRPDCASRDGRTGTPISPREIEASTGTTRRACGECLHNAWGTALQQDGSLGRGKSCRELRTLLLLSANRLLPVVVTLPPTSIRPLGRYFLSLASRATAFNHVISGLSLERTGAAPILYSIIKPRMISPLAPNVRAKMDEARTLMEPMLGAVRLDRDDYSVDA